MGPDRSGAACRACAHERAAHEHLRAGSDCALCGCRRFARPSRFATVAALLRPAQAGAQAVADPTGETPTTGSDAAPTPQRRRAEA